MSDSYTVSSSGIAFPRNNESSRVDGSRKGGIRGSGVFTLEPGETREATFVLRVEA